MDFKAFHEKKLNMDSKQFASFLEVRHSDIKKWDRDNKPTFDIIEKIMQKTGLSLEEIAGYKKPTVPPLKVETEWIKSKDIRLMDFIHQSFDKTGIPEDVKDNYINTLLEEVERRLVKPKVAIVGRSDTGKSTLINALLGQDKLPTAWTPTTSIAVYIKHINDRPDYMKNDVWIFKSEVGNDKAWDATRLNDREYCELWSIAKGDIDLLNRFGTHHDDGLDRRAGAAVVFLDAPILENCDIVDLPGFGTEKNSDDFITQTVSAKADILIYLSIANAFMRIEDIIYLKDHIRTLPVLERKGTNNIAPLANLFIVASQAHTIHNGNKDELKRILDARCMAFRNTLSAGYWRARKEKSGYKTINYGEQILRNRFFTYETEIPELCSDFNEALKSVLNAIPAAVETDVKHFISEYVHLRIPALEEEISNYQGILEQREKYSELLAINEEDELRYSEDVFHGKNEVLDLFVSLANKSKVDFTTYYGNTVNVDVIARLLDEHNIKNTKTAIQLFASKLQDILRSRCEIILENKTKVLNNKIETYLKNYKQKEFIYNKVSCTYDSTYTFLSKFALAGGVVVTLGSAVIVTGGANVIAVSASLTALGVPGIIAGLTIIGAVETLDLITGGWKRRTASNLVKIFEEQNILDGFITSINNYWQEQKDAFIKGCKAMENEQERYALQLRTTIDTYDVEEIMNRLNALKYTKRVYDEILLRLK